MHKYEKRFTGGNQLAYCRHKKWNDWWYIWDWKTIRHQVHELRNNPSEEAWDRIERMKKVSLEPDWW